MFRDFLVTRMLDIRANRRAHKWSRPQQLGRVLWWLATPLFRFSPRPFWAWRRFILRSFGAKIGREVHVHPSVRVSIPWNLEIGAQSGIGDCVILYCLGNVKIGERTTLSQGAHLCAGTHDATRADRPLLKLPIMVGEDVWVATEAFIGPGVTIGPGAIVGARAVVTKDVGGETTVVGNPAQIIRSRDKTDG